MSDLPARPSPPVGADADHIRSFVLRAGRMTPAQLRALTELGPRYGVTLPVAGALDLTAAFGRAAPTVLEIGFGMGNSFVAMAAADPARNYLGVEVHPPGVGSCLRLIAAGGLTNVRVLTADAYTVVKTGLPPASLQVIQIFFPDPWPKKRHHKRRLVNAEFAAMASRLLADGGELRLATDWEDYAEQMLAVLNAVPELRNCAADGGFVPRPAWRPLTKFERRGLDLGHRVWDAVFRKAPLSRA